jgi:hypothetical protein
MYIIGVVVDGVNGFNIFIPAWGFAPFALSSWILFLQLNEEELWGTD